MLKPCWSACRGCGEQLWNPSGPGRLKGWCDGDCRLPPTRPAHVKCEGCGVALEQGRRRGRTLRTCDRCMRGGYSPSALARKRRKARRALAYKKLERAASGQPTKGHPRPARRFTMGWCLGCSKPFVVRLWAEVSTICSCSPDCTSYLKEIKYAAWAGFRPPVYRQHLANLLSMGSTCGLCRDPIDLGLKFPDPLSLTIDHVVPQSRGGSDELANLQLAHFVCNVRKGARV